MLEIPVSHRIQKLPDFLINQIAAGEVVERPAAVVKELVENALDAGSTHLEIRLWQGGIEKIQIWDNGSGIEADDLLLAIDRHATSKLSRFEDLEAISTFGFRGEALSSIASVARLEIKTKTALAPHASRLVSEPGQPSQVESASGPKGTLIVVSQLFSKVPARQKFLKSAATEYSHCQRVVRDLALANPTVSFSLFHQDRPTFSVVKGDRSSRFSECFKTTWDPLHIQEENSDFSFELFLSPANQIQDRGELLFFINQRPVRTKTLVAALRNSYLEILGPHHEPAGVVYVDLRRDWVDVNIHPQKLEVRLLRQESLYQWLVAALRKKLPPLTTLAETPASQASFFDSEPSKNSPLPKREPFKHLGQLASGFFVWEVNQDLFLVDPHALHQMQIHWQLTQKTSSYKLKQPKIISLNPYQWKLWEKLFPLFEKIGWEIVPFGDQELMVRTVPHLVPESVVDTCLLNLLDAAPESVAQGLNTLACFLAVSRAEQFSPGRLAGLFQSLPNEPLENALRNDGHSPLFQGCRHGHQLFFRLTSRALLKHFE